MKNLPVKSTRLGNSGESFVEKKGFIVWHLSCFIFCVRRNGTMRLGSCQKEAMESLLAGRAIGNYSQRLRGRARLYRGRYEITFESLLKYLAKMGYKIERTPGPRGGEYSATYRIVGFEPSLLAYPLSIAGLGLPDCTQEKRIRRQSNECTRY